MTTPADDQQPTQDTPSPGEDTGTPGSDPVAGAPQGAGSAGSPDQPELPEPPAPLNVQEATAGAPVPVTDKVFLRDRVVAERDGSPVWRGPDLVDIEPSTTIPYLLQRRVQRSAGRPLIEVKSLIGDSWTPVSARSFHEQVLEVAAGLIGMGLEFGDSVAIMSHTRYEWTLLDFACWFAGLVPVPIYETSSLEQVRHILTDSGAVLAIAETVTLAELVRAAAAAADKPDLKVLSLDQEAIHTIRDAGVGITHDQVTARTDRLDTSSIATIVYTSGTTGRPKGTVITHGNFTDGIVNSERWMPEVNASPTSRFLLFLPLAHVFARFIEVYQIAGEGVLGHVGDMKNLLTDLRAFRPTYVFVVPRVLEKVYNSADAQATGSAQKVFRWAVKVAIDQSLAQDTPEGPSKRQKLLHAVADRLVYGKIRALVGGNLDFFICGGAPLSEHLARFYTGMGLTVLEGYGLTETVGPISVSTPSLNKIGTVGSLLPKASVTISEEGELLVRGPSVFTSYNNDPEATKAAFTEDGWFRTGDLGSVDEDGYITITGRLKELIVTAGGKNVSPAMVEDDLTSHPLISQIVVVGDKRPFIAALITLDAEMLPVWLKKHNLPPMSVAEAANNLEVHAALERAVDRANQHVSRAESIRKIKVLSTDFTEANGLLTPSLKVRRDAVLRRYADVIDDIYGGPVQDVE
ncbi:AMP-dependent synthetase/ligase [Actinomyces polynesiensis]|uniref:AMP-dependent synthetase/ligase n=1 Tax=Actinomyces polynesiensis TaxID=1325934 RepID=UPI0006934E58|nr:AMP-dependent synthetase/ligase [Actinomyces polynesiensis]